MESQPRHIELGSRIYKEDFKASWRIRGFNLMPFQDDHPVYGPWFMLGKTRESLWSVLVTKEVHGGVKNLGFRLVRAEEGTMWDMVTFSLGLKLEDGRFVKCIDQQVVGRESNNSYAYLVKTIESQFKEHVKGKGSDCPPTLAELSNRIMSCGVRGPCKIPDLKNVENGHTMFGSCGMIGSTGIETSSGLRESSAVNGSTKFEDYSSEGPSGVKVPTEADIERRDAEIISRIISIDVENRSISNVSTTLNGLPDIGESTKASKQTVEDVKNNPTTTPEELFLQETITVVCEIEYTYMMSDPVHEKEETEQEGLVANFGHLFASGKFSDITLKCENVNLSCHKAVLYTRSQLFKQFLDKTASSSAQQHQIINVNFDLPILKVMLLYMYTDELDDEFGKLEDNCWNLYKAAGLFGIPGLRSLCLEVLEEIDDCHADDSKDLYEKLSVLSISTSDQKASVDVLSPVTNISNFYF